MLRQHELAGLLRAWIAPNVTESLDGRLSYSFLSCFPVNSNLMRRHIRLADLEIFMKTCMACEEQFENKFSFCPVDGTPLNSLAAALSGYATEDKPSATIRASLPRLRSKERPFEYQPTILSSAGLPERLAGELRFLLDRAREAWPDLKSDPVAFTKRAIVEVGNLLSGRLEKDALVSASAAIFLVLSVVFFVLLHGTKTTIDTALNNDDKSLIEILTLPPSDKSQITLDAGVGTGSKGRVGFDRGKGEGSQTKPKRASGGGSGGLHDESVAQQGRPPQPSEIPAPIPKLPPARNHVLPVAGIDIDPTLWKNLPFPGYGDPRSNSPTPSNGPGDGGGMGNANGTGIGEGSGDGFGSGSDGNIGGGAREIGGGGPRGGGSGNTPYDPERVFPASQVGQRARVIAKPEPQYTDEARRNQITGTVVLRAVFSRSGDVTNIRAVQSLPFGLTEKAIAAARQIRFLPATKDGYPVSVYVQLEYNFNLY